MSVMKPNSLILSIDPGNEQSAYSLLDNNLKPIDFGKIPNNEMLGKIADIIINLDVYELEVAIEMVASYGMAVGATVFETVLWVGRFQQLLIDYNPKLIYRKDVKINLCNSMKAKDANIRQALIDRFGVVGVKANPGWFYGFKADIWSAYAVGVTYHDMYLK